ncbi:MAG TPA: hypothetical protein VIG76_14755 [Amnibacterium sp.]|jgi:hypothetical protein|uniref:hypothetical protein n=1 Tax=Amnibacterium sp. TaxID=1872496 RepID=UPI002F932352
MRLDAERTASTREVDALRRRLYAPDASAEDLERYRAAEQADSDLAAVTPASEAAPVRRGRLLGVGAVLAALGVAAVGLAVGTRPPAVAPSLAPAASAAAPAQALIDYEALAIPAAVRTSFVDEVRRGHPIGLQQYFDDHPAQQPRQVVSGLRENSVEQAGTGSALLDIPPAGAATDGGQLTLVLTVDRPTTARWSLVAPGNRDDGDWVALDAVQGRPGLPAVASLPYTPLRPTRVAITVPAGVRWDLMTIFTG